MRIALISDVHGNHVALDSVLDDAGAHGAEQFWFLGDFCAIGPEPAAVVERVNALRNALFIRGNTDRYVITGEGPPPHLPEVVAYPELVPTYARIAAALAWTRGFVTATGWLDWLERLPLESRRSTPAGVRILAVHACPGTDDGEGIHPGRSNAELRELLAGCEADLVVVGHTHEPMVRRVGDTFVVNPGSVGNPKAPDLRASYALLDTTHDGVEVMHRRVDYDHAAFVDAVRRSRYPSADFILSHHRGEQPGRPPHADHTPIELGRSMRLDVRHRRAGEMKT